MLGAHNDLGRLAYAARGENSRGVAIRCRTVTTAMILVWLHSMWVGRRGCCI